MACRAERAAALAWGAARAADEAPAEHPLAAAAAAALALDDAVDNAKDCIQVLGGIGFTWEHDAHLYLRRALALRQLLGGSPAWRTRAAAGQAAAPRSTPRTSGAPARASPPSTPGPGPRSPGTARGPAGTLRWPDTARRDHLVPAVQRARGRLGPGVAADQGAARRRGLAADRPEGVDVAGAPGGLGDLPGPHRPGRPKHEGLTFFLVNMHAPGIEIRPLREITGRTMFNQVFLDDVFVPDDCVLGAPGDGWRVAMSTLATERVAMGGGQDEAVQSLLAAGGAANPDYAERAGVHVASGRAVALLEQRGAHPAIRKLIGTGHRQAVAETALELLGPAAPPPPVSPARPATSSCSPGACPSPAAPRRSC